MSNIEKIRQEIERRRHDYGKRMLKPDGMVARAKFDELTCLLAFIDSLPEEKPSEDLEEAADEYYDNTFDELGGFAETRDGSYDIFFPSEAIRRSFIAGAEWMSKRMNNE